MCFTANTEIIGKLYPSGETNAGQWHAWICLQLSTFYHSSLGCSHDLEDSPIVAFNKMVVECRITAPTNQLPKHATLVSK